jgi:hypothetical protein
MIKQAGPGIKPRKTGFAPLYYQQAQVCQRGTDERGCENVKFHGDAGRGFLNFSANPRSKCHDIAAMQKTITFLFRLSVISILFLSACTVNYQVDWSGQKIAALDAETGDLADVAADALALSQSTGKDQLLVVFDIDNTILAMEQGLGTDQWYEWQKELSTSDQCNKMNVGNRFAVQGALYFASAMRPTQADAASQVRNIQDSGVQVIALTSRGEDYRLQTFRELRRNGYNFTYTAIGPAGGYEQSFVPVEGGRMSRYEDGVFMTAGQHKGDMLQALLQKTGAALPVVIVMTDDKQQNLDAVKETFGALNVPVRAWRYTGEDENVENFDPERAHAEWKSIEAALRQVQQVLGPDNYDLSSAVPPKDCE